MVFISLEGVLEGSADATTRAVAVDKAPIRVVVTPGSTDKCCDVRGRGAVPARRLRRLLPSRSQAKSASHLVCFVTDAVVQHKWVVIKPTSDYAQLRKQLLRVVAGCKQPRQNCCGPIRALAKAKLALSSQFSQCSAVEEFVNALLSAVLTRDTTCSAHLQARQLVELFLDVDKRREDAVDQLVRLASQDSHAETPTMSDDEAGAFADEPTECSICCGDIGADATMRLACDHVFHAGCVRLWLKLQQTCPVCSVAARGAAIASETA